MHASLCEEELYFACQQLMNKKYFLNFFRELLCLVLSFFLQSLARKLFLG